MTGRTFGGGIVRLVLTETTSAGSVSVSGLLQSGGSSSWVVCSSWLQSGWTTLAYVSWDVCERNSGVKPRELSM